MYLRSFPAHERLPYFPLVVNSWRKIANFYAYYNHEEFVGFAYVLSTTEAYFILFLAVNDLVHSKGYGSKILQDLRQDAGKRPIMLAIEPMNEEAANRTQRKKRLAFYERNGFELTQHFYYEGSERYQIMLTNPNSPLSLFENMMHQAFWNLIPIKMTSE
ncbi:hypothetical protein STRDD13_00350 [Streptococcus sp. DD13]|nr:hypothetical protein STRDD13_00350 [Streptococcus sp. DD13]